jgi:hypothetical protein
VASQTSKAQFKKLMTIINHVFLEPTDIIAVRLECKKCQSTLSFPLSSWSPTPLPCPNPACGVALIPSTMQNSEEYKALDALSVGLKKLRVNAQSFPFNLQFEFNQP